MEDFIVIAVFSTEIEAEFARATLAAAGLESFLKYEDTGHMIPVLQLSQGVRLLVRTADAEEARTILSSQPTEQPGD